jgi:hypothetical protein
LKLKKNISLVFTHTNYAAGIPTFYAPISLRYIKKRMKLENVDKENPVFDLLNYNLLGKV